MSRRNIVILLLLFTGTAAVWVMLMGTVSHRWALSIASSHFSGPAGCKALYLELQELKLPVTRFQKPFSRLKREKGVLVIVHPERVPFTKREISFLEEWVQDGNRLILFQGMAKEAYDASLEERHTKNKTEAFEMNTMQKLSGSFGLSIKRFETSSRKRLDTHLRDPDLSVEISVSSRFRWKKPSGSWSWKEIAGDEAGPIIVSRKFGKGEIIAISDASLPSNVELSHAQNLKLVLALLIAKPPEKIIFDEYHHGHTIQDTFWNYFGASIFALVLLQSIVGAAIFFYSKRASYAGRFKSMAISKGRSSLEYVDSMANIFQSCAAGSAALEPIFNRFLSQFSRKAGIPLKMIANDFSNAVAFQETTRKQELAGLVKECRNTVSSEAEPAKALGLARRLATFRAGMNRIKKRTAA
ncbi:MAG: DUF4350 domain-containing protein [Desulfomonilaceae bacterium]